MVLLNIRSSLLKNCFKKMKNINKNIRLLLILIIFSRAISCFTQPKSEIDLPKGGKELSFYGAIEFFITKNQEVYSENKRYKRYDDISNLILSKIDIPSLERRVLLYADKSLRYIFIDKIKQEIALVEKRLFLMTDTIGHVKKGQSIFLNSYLNRSKNVNSILTLEQDIKNQKLNKPILSSPLLPPKIWYHNFEDIIYSGKKEAIQNA